MSSKVDLQRKLKEIGYEIGPFASKETLSNVIRLHSLALQNTGVNVATLNDLDLRKYFIENGLNVGPVTSHTRSIYQRKLLEVLTNEKSEGLEDDIEIEIPTSTTPSQTIRSSIIRNGNDSITSSPGRNYSTESHEPRIPLTRISVEDTNVKNTSNSYSNISSTKSKPEQSITSSYTSTKSESRSSNLSYGLRNPYDFHNDEPMIIRHEHKATPFRTTNISSSDTLSMNTTRSTKQTELPTIMRTDLNEIRSRILSNTSINEQNDTKSNKDPTLAKPNYAGQTEKNEKLEVQSKSGGAFFYGVIAVTAALIVFVLYLFLEK